MDHGPRHGAFNLFFALRPPDGASAAMDSLGARLQRAHRLRGARIARERLHTTLAPLLHRDVKDNIARARQAGAELRSPAFPVRFEWTQSFDVHRDRYPLVLRGDLVPLMDFQQALAARIAGQGLPVSRSYTPHTTLLWADRAVEDYPIAPVEWMVTQFALILSMVGQSRHVILDHWQLG